MNQSRFILKQIHVGKTGNSDLTRYISKSKLDHEREGEKARPLFSEHEDGLTAMQAKKFLSITGGELEKTDVLHYVLSFSNEKEFESLGCDEETRRREVAITLRESIREALASIGVAEMRWVAGLHRNTDNPHLHILFNKNAIEKETGELIRVAKLPASLVAHNTRQHDGTREFSYGIIINSFAEQVDARVQVLQLEIAPSSREVLETKALQQQLTRDSEKEISSTSIISQDQQQKEQSIEREKEKAKEQTQEQTRTVQRDLRLL